MCCQCGGDIPPKTQWGKDGESANGECVRQRSDGMCGAFGPRAAYEEEWIEIAVRDGDDYADCS